MRRPEVNLREFRLSKLRDPQFSHLLLLLGWVGYFALYFLTENLIPAEDCYLHRGNVKELAEMGEITADSFDIIIPDVLAGKAEARTDPKHRIYAQIIGTGMLDVACAGLLLQKLETSGQEVFRFDMTK